MSSFFGDKSSRFQRSRDLNNAAANEIDKAAAQLIKVIDRCGIILELQTCDLYLPL